MSKYEIVWNYHGPRWRGRPEVKQIREEDTDWRRWLLGKPYRPFDPRLYFEFRLYKDFSSGIADQWMSHGIDLAHYFMDETFPRSVVAHGGVFAWPDGRENPDTFQALVEYPKGFLVSYSTSFGNDCDSFTRIMGKKATLINIGGEGSPRWKIVEEKGKYEDNPYVKRAEKYVTLPGEDRIPPTYISDNVPYHMRNWFECLRSRKQPNATVRHGYSHAVAVIMAARSYREGKKAVVGRGRREDCRRPCRSNKSATILPCVSGFWRSWLVTGLAAAQDTATARRARAAVSGRTDPPRHHESSRETKRASRSI